MNAHYLTVVMITGVILVGSCWILLPSYRYGLCCSACHRW